MEHEYKTSGTCSRRIRFRVEDGRVYDVEYTDGCHGNLQGIARLVEGMETGEVIRRLRGIRCGRKATSCPDQLAQALEKL